MPGTKQHKLYRTVLHAARKQIVCSQAASSSHLYCFPLAGGASPGGAVAAAVVVEMRNLLRVHAITIVDAVAYFFSLYFDDKKLVNSKRVFGYLQKFCTI